MNPPAAVVNTFWWSTSSAFEVPVDVLPVALVERPSRILAGLLVFFGGSLDLTGVGLIFKLVREGDFGLGAVLGIGALLLASTPILLAGLNLFVKRQATTLDETAVRWDTRTLFRRTSREEPIGAFAGVAFKTVVWRSDGTELEFDVLELAHADPACVVRVFKARAGKPIADHWAAFCRRFRLPAIEDITPEYRVTRDLIELDTPLVELLRRGHAALPSASHAQPATMSLREDPGELTVQLSDDHAIAVTERGLTDRSRRRDAVVAARAKWVGMALPGDLGRFYPRDDIQAFVIEEIVRLREPGVVMIVRHPVETDHGTRVERRRVELHADDSLEACLWLHAVLLRAVLATAPSAV